MIVVDRFNIVSAYALCGGFAALQSTTEQNTFWFAYLVVLAAWSIFLAIAYYFQESP